MPNVVTQAQKAPYPKKAMLHPSFISKVQSNDRKIKNKVEQKYRLSGFQNNKENAHRGMYCNQYDHYVL